LIPNGSNKKDYPILGLHYVFIFTWVLPAFFNAQDKNQPSSKDTVKLHEVEIIQVKINNAAIGKKTQLIDSLSRSLFNAQSIGEILSLHSTVFIKNYGPGSVSTTSFRGSNAQQTAVLWNGFNIQNNMLGQLDLGAISGNLFNQTQVEYGPSSGNWGSGAIGGSIHLNNEHRFLTGTQSSNQYLHGSTGLHSFNSSTHFGGEKISLSIRFSALKNENKFKYVHPINEETQIQQNAQYNNYQLVPEMKYLINNKQTIQAGAWLSKSSSHFPTHQNASALQENDANRWYTQWNYFTNKIRSSVRSAYFTEQLNYTDSMSRIFSEAKMKNFILETDNYFQWHPYHTLHIGLNHTSNGANSNNYETSRELIRNAILIGNASSLLNNKLFFRVIGRAEQTNTEHNPLSGDIGIEYRLKPYLNFKMNAARVYRLPTLNDLYWYPGGNPQLNPEYGHALDGSIDYSLLKGNWSLSISGSAYTKKINNWILWVPGAGGLPKAMNVQRVWSRGTETDSKISWSKNKTKLHLGFISSYVLSTVANNALENDNSKGKQLIYTPRYMFNTHAGITYKTLVFCLYHQYVGYRFTTSDNSEWLNPYHYFSARIMYNVRIHKTTLGTFLHINNPLNQQYQIIANRPMPLRNFETGITLQFYKPLKNKP